MSTHVVDVADRAAMTALSAAVEGAHGGAHLLVNDAGVSVAGRFEAVPLADLARVLVGMDYWITDWLARLSPALAAWLAGRLARRMPFGAASRRARPESRLTGLTQGGRWRPSIATGILWVSNLPRTDDRQETCSFPSVTSPTRARFPSSTTR